MLLDQLIDNLNRQIEVHESLLKTLQNESEMPASCDIDELENNQRERDKLVNEIKVLENNRLKITEAYCSTHQLSETASLKVIIGHCQESEKAMLTQQREQLKEIIAQITEKGKQNASQANARIACFTEIQGMVNKALKRSPTYTFSGMMKKPKGAYLMRKSV